ncbi:MAG: TetR/AcrR family transcriptional regulator [Clostridia bacterium]|nr:TetR/AcrR family transcriptional regulator [Clostridia bacterium]
MKRSELNNQVKGVNMPKTKLGLAKMHRLVEAAEVLFTSKGFFETSITDICKAANTAVGTFYIYFNSKTDLYRYLMEKYKLEIRRNLAESIAESKSRLEAEKEGVKCFICYAVKNPNVYNIIWGSLAVEKEMFEDYYVSFAKSYAKALERCGEEIKIEDATSLAYMLMGITNFLGLKAIFEQMSEKQIDYLIESSVLPVLKGGAFS